MKHFNTAGPVNPEDHLVIFDKSEGRGWDEKIYHHTEIHGDKTIEVWGT